MADAAKIAEPTTMLAALSFALTNGSANQWLRERW
jgi:hypothetical protein